MTDKQKLKNIVQKLVLEISTDDELRLINSDLTKFYELLEEKRLERILIDIDMTNHSKKIEIHSAIEESEIKSDQTKRMINKILDYDLLLFFSARNFQQVLKIFKEESTKLERLKLITAVKFNNKQISEFKRKLEDIYGAHIILTTEVNPSLKGGFLLRRGAQIIDYSVQTALEKYRQRWLKNLIG